MYRFLRGYPPSILNTAYHAAQTATAQKNLIVLLIKHSYYIVLIILGKN